MFNVQVDTFIDRARARATCDRDSVAMSRSPSRPKRPRHSAGLTQNDLMMSSALPQSLLSARRPTNAPSISFRDVPTAMQNLHNTRDTVNLDSEPSSPEDGGTFKRSMQIDNKGLVGDAVGNVSRIS